jgi:hypothetical protein
MTVAIWIFSLPLIAEFAVAPVNLWTGRTMANFAADTGLPAWIATRVFAPVKLAGAVLLAIGLGVPSLSVAGASVLAGGCCAYLVRLSAPGRRDTAGLVAFSAALGCAFVIVLLRLVG